MGNVYLLYSRDITTRVMNDAIVERVRQSRKTVYLISTYGLKSVRLDMNAHTLTEESVMTIGELEHKAKAKVYKRKSYITRADGRYLLSRIIDKRYHGTSQSVVFKSITNDLHSLFEFLQWSDVPPLEQTVLDYIRQDYSDYEHDIFLLYGEFCLLTAGLIRAAKSGEAQISLEEYGVGCSGLARKTLETFNQQLKAEIDREISQGSAIFFDGFNMLTDIVKYTMESALRQDKDVYFVAKLDLASYEESFIYEENYKVLAEKYGKEIQSIRYDAVPYEDNTALDYFRRIYPNVYLTPSHEEQARIHDGSIELIAPFSSRESEFTYIVQRISDYLKGLHTTDPAVLKAALENDIAVLTPAHWERHAYMMKSLLKRTGLFVLRDQLDEAFVDIDRDSIGSVYYSKREFMDADARWADGTSLHMQEKLVFFEKCFIGLSIKASPRPISAYPVGQYIRQLYSFVVDGMDTHKFKLVLYSNWFYHTRRSSRRWDSYISDFDLIEHYFSNKSTIGEWYAEFEELAEIKAQIQNNPLYVYHPLTLVPDESLAFLKEVTKVIGGIMECIDFVGTIEQHMASLVHDVIDAFEIIDEDRDQLELEQVIICRLNEAAEALSGSALINEIDATYFAQNILHMLEDYEQEQAADEDAQYAFSLISVEHVKKYKVVFFPMAERGKHPRNYREQFPYSKEIVEILTDERYGINSKPAALHGLEYHLLWNSHAVQNLLDFTQEKLIITQSKYDSESENAPSIYCEDIATAFGYELPELYVYPTVARQATVHKKKLHQLRLPKKASYSVTELALFKLCPKLYWHSQKSDVFVYRDPFQLKLYFQNIVFVDILMQFSAQCTAENKIFSACDDEALRMLLALLPQAFERHLPPFSFLRGYEVSDAKKFVQRMICDFVCYEIINKNTTGCFSVRRVPPAAHTCNGYTLLLDYDMIIHHGQKYNHKQQKYFPDSRSYQSLMLIDFLALHSKQASGEFLKHYQEIICALNRNDTRQDRVKLAARIITKINAQFESDNERFTRDGVARTDGLVDEIERTDILFPRLPVSEYCRYCKVGDICKGYYMNTRGDDHAS